MDRLYEDLRSRLGEPLWHDEQGVPRYDSFHPNLCGVYDTHVALLEIACQGCEKRFLVSSSWNHHCDLERFARTRGTDVTVLGPQMPDATNGGGSFGYGDAPWHGDPQCAGTTMATEVVRVVEFWTRDFEWQRRQSYEFCYT